MRPGDKKFVLIAHALIHGGMILLASLLLRGTGHHQTVTYLIVALWCSTAIMLTHPERVACEIRCLMRFFSFGSKSDGAAK